MKGSATASVGQAAFLARAGALSSLVIAASCASRSPVDEGSLEPRTVAVDAPRPADSAKPGAWVGAREVASNGGTYRVAWRASPEAIPRGQTFAIDAWIFAADDPRRAPLPLANVKLDVDATMPEHGHGMNRIPRITRRDDGGFHVEGLLFHMPGRWELHLDVTSGAITERAQVKLELE